MSSRPSVKSFFDQYPISVVKAGDKIVRPTNQTDSLIYMKSGFLKIYSYSKSGQEIVLSYINVNRRENMLVGVFPSHRSPDNYISCLSDVELIRAPRCNFVKYISDNPELTFDVLGNVYRFVGDLYHRIETMGVGTALNKVASVICFFADEFGEKYGKAINIPIDLTHDDFARVCGIARETATVQLLWLKWHGMITYHKRRVTVIDHDSLAKLMEFDSKISKE